MKESAWLVSAEAEDRVVRREGYVLCPEFFRRAKVQTGLVVVAAAIMIVAFRATTYEGVLFAVAFLSLGSIPLAYHWEKRQEARHEPDIGIREGFGNGPGWLVEMIVRQGETPTGTDHGMLWIEEGRLYFSGHRTSFGLVPAQAGRLTTEDIPLSGVRHEINLPLKNTTNVGDLSLSFELLLPPEVERWAAKEAFRNQIAAWRARPSSQEGQWPPLDLGPAAPSERKLLAVLILHAVPLPIVLIGIGLVFQSASILYPIVAFVAAAFAIGQENNLLRLAAFRGRRKLRRKA